MGKGSKERELYGKVLARIFNVAFIYVVVTFFIYAGNFLPSYVSKEDTTNALHLRASEYAERTGGISGWAWVNHLDQGDMLSFSGVVFLAMISFFTYLVIFKAYLNDRNWIYAVLVMIQIGIFIAAAFGVSGGGH